MCFRVICNCIGLDRITEIENKRITIKIKTINNYLTPVINAYTLHKFKNQ